jgi:thiamine-phosphate pyrophosphorylase
MPGGRLFDETVALTRFVHQAGGLFVLNDRADLARMAETDGVHLGQEDLPPRAVRPIVGPEALVGLSTHTPTQIERAVLEPVSYLAVGPVFGTATKETGYDAVGLALVRYAARQAHAQSLPLVAIGGITLELAPSVLEAGAQSVAVITDLFRGERPTVRVRQFLAALA